MVASGSWSIRGLVGLLSLIWGFNFIFTKIGLAEASPLWLAFLRAAVGAAGTVALLLALNPGLALHARGRWEAMAIGIPSTTAFYALLFIGIDTVLPGFASVLIYTFPLWVAVFSPWVLHHRLTPRLLGALVAGFAGVVLVSQPWNDLHGAVTAVAILELLGGAIAWAIGTVLFQRRFSREEMLEANAYQLLGGTVGLAVLVTALAPTPLPALTPALVGILVWLGIIGTSVAYTVWSYLLGHTRAVTLSAYLFLVPVVALAASAVIFQERLAVIQLLGVALVFVAIYGIGTAPGAHDLELTE
jgi:drug/metabolite transporter (DMT)-like permease